MEDKNRKVVRICDMGDKDFDDYDDDTLFELYDPPLKNPLLKNESTIDEKSK